MQPTVHVMASDTTDDIVLQDDFIFDTGKADLVQVFINPALFAVRAGFLSRRRTTIRTAVESFAACRLRGAAARLDVWTKHVRMDRLVSGAFAGVGYVARVQARTSGSWVSHRARQMLSAARATVTRTVRA